MATASTDAEDEHVQLAVALFELKFPEHRIEAALKHCRTQAEAVAWLQMDEGELACNAAESSASAAASAPSRQPKENRRRVNKKTSDAFAPSEEQSLTQSLIREAPSPMHVCAHNRLEFALQGDGHSNERDGESPHPDASLRADAVEAESVEIRPLQPEQASAWWAKASTLWPQLRFGKRSCFDDTGEQAPGTPMKKLRGSQLSPSGSDTSCRLQGSAAGRDAAAVSSTPPEATTKSCSPSSSSAARASGEVSKRESTTPGTSPRAQMRYNPAAEVCAICCDEFEKGSAVRLGCRHGWYCLDCMVKHAEARLEVGAAHIACPECAAPIPECNLRKLLPATIIERLLARSLEQAVSSIADLRACPTPNCPMRVALEEGEDPRLECPQCKKESCLQCGAQPYHRGLTCEEFEERARARGRRKADAIADDTFRQWMQETGTKQCPTCGSAVTKEDLDAQSTQYKECHKMLCRVCNAKFCFKCLTLLTDSFTCGCSNDKHGFCDPRTGKRVEHLQKPGRTAAKSAQKPAVRHKGRR